VGKGEEKNKKKGKKFNSMIQTLEFTQQHKNIRKHNMHNAQPL
jgi:hypothetical protein